MKYIKYIPYVIIIILGLLAGYFYQANVKSTKSDRIHLSQKDSLGALLYVSNKNYQELYNAKTKVDTVIIYKEGKIKIVYKEIPVVIKDSTKILKDSLKTDDLYLKWQITYTGEIFDFFPSWDVTQKTIIKNTISYVDRPVPVPTKINGYYFSYYYGIDLNNIQLGIHDVSVGRQWKSGIGLGGGFIVVQSKVYPKLGFRIVL